MAGETRWLGWARELQALAQTGLTYGKDPFDIERYERIREIAAEIVADHANASYNVILDLFKSETGHATPKLDVRGAIFNAGCILLVKERKDGLWTLPGGWVDVGEPPSTAVEREVYEEAGYTVRAAKLLAVYDRSKHGHPPHMFHIYKLFFRCDIIAAAETPALAPDNLEIDAVDFFPPDALPDLSIGRVTAAQIARLFEHSRHPEWPTDFD